MDDYISKAETTVIKFTSRASIKICDSFFTFEYGEERQIIDSNEVNLDKEIKILTRDCNRVIDEQVDETVRMILNNNKKTY